MGPHHEMRPFTRGILLNSPFLYSDYYSDYDYSGNDSSYDSGETDVADSAQTRVMLVRRAAEDSPRRTKPAPLLIEWQGDRYVRFGGAEETGQRGSSAQRDYAEPAITKSLTKAFAAAKEPAESQARELPPAVLVLLVYRDGHREEISDYAIANGMIYVQGDSWQDGYGTKHIPLSSLDPSATMQANEQRGVKFMLPSASNVVIASF